MSKSIYYTIDKPTEGLYKDKGSKFLAFAFPVENETQIKHLLAELKTKYHDARHHCYAYRLGKNGDNFRANDDGEPSGTAGKPIYGQILSKNLTNILIVVVRYFGGILLGTGGLVQAYKQASMDALTNAQIIEKTIELQVDLYFGYEQMHDVVHILKEEQIENAQYNLYESCHIAFIIPMDKRNHFQERFSLVSNIKAKFERNE